MTRLLPLSIFQHRYVLGQLIKRDVLLRYRGAYFGLLWIFLNPIIMLGIFVFVFGHIFQMKWPQDTGSVPYPLHLYCGLIAFNIFGEAVSRSPSAVRSYPSYVKKIIFPVELLPIVPLGSALIHAVFNTIILIAGLAWVGELHASQWLFPVLLLPLFLFSLGLAWFLAAWGVFIKDMTQIVPVFVQMMLFLSPVFYPAQAVPEALRGIYGYNPLGAVIGSLRAALAGQSIAWPSWLTAMAIALFALLMGYAFFQHSRDEFADAL